MKNRYKILSLLLDYPNKELYEVISDIVQLFEENRELNDEQMSHLCEFINYIKPMSLSKWQMVYVQMFDYSPRTNLYLFDHVYGNSRERGQAMVDLNEMYEKSGFKPNTNELPDFLPVFLEYLSLLDDSNESDILLREVSHILKNMRKALKKKKSPYYHLLEILCSLSDVEVDNHINVSNNIKI